MYTGAKTVVRTVYGNSNGFKVKVDMHQGSALRPVLFVTVTFYVFHISKNAFYSVFERTCQQVVSKSLVFNPSK